MEIKAPKPKKMLIPTVKDIIAGGYVKWKDVNKAVKFHFPGDKNNYEDLFYKIGKMKKVPTKKGESLIITGGIDYTEKWFQESGQKWYLDEIKNDNSPEAYHICIKKEGEEMTYSCSFVRWAYMASLPIEPMTFKHLSMFQIVACFLWEITFYGDEETMLKHGKKLNSIVKEIKSGKAKTVEVEKTAVGVLYKKLEKKNAKKLPTKSVK
jgi:hypothetical protein